MENIEELKDRINVLNELINKYEQQYQQQLLKDKEDYSSFHKSEKTKQIEEKLYKFVDEKIKIEKFIEISNKEPIASEESVDLYVSDKNFEGYRGYYTVCLHNTKTIIGEVGCSNQDNKIFYKIDDEYQNNGYGFQALVALVNYLVLNSVENIVIVIESKNTPSIKLAEKLKIIFPNCNRIDNGDCFVYHFDLSKSIDEEHNISR